MLCWLVCEKETLVGLVSEKVVVVTLNQQQRVLRPRFDC